MGRNLLPLWGAILGLALSTVGHVHAQSTVVGKGDQKTVIGSTAGPVNAVLDRSPTQTDQSGTGPLQLSDLLNYRIVTQDGGFGQIADAVIDHNGRLLYLVGSSEGKIFPLPFTYSALNPSGNTVTYNVSTSTLRQLTLDPHYMPSLNNSAFVLRMQQVFGPSFGMTPSQAVSAYPPTGVGATSSTIGATAGRNNTAVPTPTGRMENGPTRPTGGSLNSDQGIEPRNVGVGGNTTTSASGALSGAAIGGAPGSTGGTSGTAGGAPASSPGTGRPLTGEIGGSNGTGGTGTAGSGAGTTGSTGKTGAGGSGGSGS